MGNGTLPSFFASYSEVRDSFWFLMRLSNWSYLYHRSTAWLMYCDTGKHNADNQTVRQEGCCDVCGYGWDLLTHKGGRPESGDEEVACAPFSGWVNSREDSQSENGPVRSYPDATSGRTHIHWRCDSEWALKRIILMPVSWKVWEFLMLTCRKTSMTTVDTCHSSGA